MTDDELVSVLKDAKEVAMSMSKDGIFLRPSGAFATSFLAPPVRKLPRVSVQPG